MDKNQAQDILNNAVENVQNEFNETEPFLPCFICGSEAYSNNVIFYVDDHELRIKENICENCYDNIKYKVIDIMVEHDS